MRALAARHREHAAETLVEMFRRKFEALPRIWKRPPAGLRGPGRLVLLDLVEEKMVADMGVEIAPQGIRENQPVINLLGHLFIDIGAMGFAEGGAQGVR